jgi:hypothetical protein
MKSATKTPTTGTGFGKDRIDRALRRFRAFLNGESREPILSVYHNPVYRQEADPETMVAKACEVIRADGASGEPDILPTFIPDFGTISTAALYGGRRIPARHGGNIHIEPIARRLQDLERITPCPFEESDYQRAIDLYRKVCERLGTDNVFVRTPDFQGPMNTLGLLMDQTALICGLYDDPDMLRSVLSRITDTLIAYNQRFLDAVGADKVVGNIWPYTVLPGGMGIALTQDFMPLLNTELYAQFELPLLKRIADHFGGVWIHCCGVFAHHLRTLRDGGFKIWGIELHYPETPPKDVFEVFGHDIAYLPYVTPRGQREFPTLAAFYRSLSGQDLTEGRFWICACHEWCDVSELRRAVQETFGHGR